MFGPPFGPSGREGERGQGWDGEKQHSDNRASLMVSASAAVRRYFAVLIDCRFLAEGACTPVCLVGHGRCPKISRIASPQPKSKREARTVRPRLPTPAEGPKTRRLASQKRLQIPCRRAIPLNTERYRVGDRPLSKHPTGLPYSSALSLLAPGC